MNANGMTELPRTTSGVVCLLGLVIDSYIRNEDCWEEGDREVWLAMVRARAEIVKAVDHRDAAELAAEASATGVGYITCVGMGGSELTDVQADKLRSEIEGL
jgi:hypothetical protein